QVPSQFAHLRQQLPQRPGVVARRLSVARRRKNQQNHRSPRRSPHTLPPRPSRSPAPASRCRTRTRLQGSLHDSHAVWRTRHRRQGRTSRMPPRSGRHRRPVHRPQAARPCARKAPRNRPRRSFRLRADRRRTPRLRRLLLLPRCSAAGLSEAAYRRVTYDLTLSAASALAPLNPGMTFIYVSGEGTDSTEQSRAMWERVKGQTENALLRLPFKAAYMFRPAYIQPMSGIKSKTGWYSAMYAVVSPLYPLLRRLIPAYVTTTEELARAMLVAAKHGAPTKIMNTSAI